MQLTGVTECSTVEQVALRDCTFKELVIDTVEAAVGQLHQKHYQIGLFQQGWVSVLDTVLLSPEIT